MNVIGAKEEKKFAEIPKKEIVWVHFLGASDDEYWVTSTADRTTYFLYKKAGDGIIRVAKDKSPVLFNDMMCPLNEAAKKVQKQR